MLYGISASPGKSGCEIGSSDCLRVKSRKSCESSTHSLLAIWLIEGDDLSQHRGRYHQQSVLQLHYDLEAGARPQQVSWFTFPLRQGFGLEQTRSYGRRATLRSNFDCICNLSCSKTAYASCRQYLDFRKAGMHSSSIRAAFELGRHLVFQDLRNEPFLSSNYPVQLASRFPVQNDVDASYWMEASGTPTLCWKRA
jgi:hypothetical protein